MRIKTSFNRRTVITLLAAGTSPAFSQFRVEVTGVGMTQIPVGIIAFRGEAQAPQKISQIVRADLERSGLFRSIDTAGQAADETTRLDLSVRYEINERFSVFMDANNLTDERGVRYQGQEHRPYEVEGFGRKYLFGVRASF